MLVRSKLSFFYNLILLLGLYFSHPDMSYTQGNYALNDKEIISDSLAEYSFFVTGHFHGSSNNNSGKPAVTLLRNLDYLNSIDCKFWVSLGDLFKDIKNDIPQYKKLLIEEIEKPLFNVPGNHDKSGTVYEENFGKTFFYFIYKTELFIFLDTELEDGNISGEQWSLFEKALSDLKNVKSVFVFTHRLIWAEEHPQMIKLFTDNTRSSGGNNFRSEVLPLVKQKCADKNVFFMGGSLGAAPAPFFYHKEGNITYLATSIRDTPKDAFLKVNVKNGKVSFESIPLKMPIEYYNLKYYEKVKVKDDSFRWRLVPLYIKNMLSHRYFWYGILMMVIPFLGWILYRKIKTKK